MVLVLFAVLVQHRGKLLVWLAARQCCFGNRGLMTPESPLIDVVAPNVPCIVVMYCDSAVVSLWNSAPSPLFEWVRSSLRYHSVGL